MAVRILAFDQANKCGYTFGITGEKPKTFELTLGKTSTPSGEYLWGWSQTVKELIDRYNPDLVAWEAPFFSQATATSGSRLLKMEGALEIICYAKRVRTKAIHNQTWKKDFTGNGKFGKDVRPYPPLLECEQRGIDVGGSNDRADSCGIWFSAAIKEDPKGMADMDKPLFAYSQK